MDSAVQRFWTALAVRDGDAMAACYAPDATFEDPVFRLKGAEVGAMWRMLMGGASDLAVTTTPIDTAADATRATGTWTATYTFSLTGRKVTNRISSTFELQGGLIGAHRDTFSFWRWSRMALGAKGALLGWTPLLRNAVRAKARRRLEAFMQKEAAQRSAPTAPARPAAQATTPPSRESRSRTR